MLRYIFKRVLAAIMTIWFIMTITFFLMNAIPGDPFTSEKMADPILRQAMAEKYGLDKPIMYRYCKYMGDYLHGDFGLSYAKKGLTANEIIASGFPYSIRILCDGVTA
jgi:oligopeptide transport system permease protein